MCVCHCLQEKERPHTLPGEEGLYVPTTMEEGNSTGEDYSRLRQPHHSKGSNDDSAFFEGPDIFNEPASSTNEIYQQLSSWKAREIIRKYITLHHRIGSGHFATVCRGVWQRPGGEQEVAVKELKSGAVEEDRVKFLQEAAIMSQFNHTNVVKLHGIVTIDEPLLIVMELMPNGDLKNYLDRFTANRRSPRQRRSPGSTPPPSPGSLLPITPSLPHQLLSFCRQVADGMEYLAQKRFVHRDLATRNIFLTKDFTCKIGDFGLARDLGGDDLYQSTGGKIPVKWTAPEALQYRHFTSASDAWSYGMVLFEIWSLGHRPFDACSIEKDVMELIGSNVCQPPPPGCPREMYKLMTLCWNNKASNRPSFSHICEYLNQSDSKLLKLPAELPSTLSPQATQLGASLAEGKGLYSDLQYGYEESIV
ncbi:Ephrin type-A receptor 4a (Fragment) [Geodia barretti]|uniref:Ephrin type-A receptor 4a n=1 Tax=Geodia barretti TaxID=519541 RepID=A0AA35TY05_GEOBA